MLKFLLLFYSCWRYVYINYYQWIQLFNYSLVMVILTLIRIAAITPSHGMRLHYFRALGVPCVDYSYDDCRLMRHARQHKLPPHIGLIEVQKLRQELGLVPPLQPYYVLRSLSYSL